VFGEESVYEDPLCERHMNWMVAAIGATRSAANPLVL